MPSTTLSNAESRAVTGVDREKMVDAVRALVRIESWDGKETPAQELVRDLMHEAGLDVDSWPIDLEAVQSRPECSYEIERDSALGVAGTLRGQGGGRTLILNGHVDVVPPGDERLWTHEPFAAVVENGRIYGRGALDMKGPLMAGLFALRAVRDAGIDLAGSVRLQSVVGEEDGGLGTLDAILRSESADGAIVMEPTQLVVAPLQAGCVNFRVRVPGLAAHGAVREEGVNAFEKMFVVYRALQELEARRNESPPPDVLFSRYQTPFPISVGTMAGGDWASSVPDHIKFEGRMGVRPTEDLEEARRELERAVSGAAEGDAWLRAHPPTVEWWGGRFLPTATPPDHILTQTLQSAASDVIGRPVPLEGVTFGADAGLLSRVGRTPTVLFGAGDIRRAHRPDEFVDIEELVTMARALAVFVIRFCG